jgi:hypothetical protein
MKDFSTVEKNLKKRGFSVRVFPTGDAACAYLNGAIDGVSVGFGGSVTLDTLGLFDSLSAHNQVAWHWREHTDAPRDAMRTDVYLTSVNALAETGELINIDGTGNRVSSTLYGHRKVYFIIGRNKLAPDYDQALWRARNIAAPKNAQRLNRKTPCALKADRCYDCNSPERICRGLVVLWAPMKEAKTEVVLIDEDLGY